MVTGMRDTGGMDLGKAGVGKHRAFLISAKNGTDIGRFSIGGKIIYVGIAPGRKDNRISGMAFQFAIDQIANDNAAVITSYSIHYTKLYVLRSPRKEVEQLAKCT